MKVKKIIPYDSHPRTLQGDIVELEISVQKVDLNTTEKKILLMYNSRIQGRVVPSYYIEKENDIWLDVITTMNEVQKAFDSLNNIPNLNKGTELDLTVERIIPTDKRRKTYTIIYNNNTIIDNLSMRRTVLETIRIYLHNNIDKDLDTILEEFNNHNLPSKNYDLIKSKSDFDTWIKFRDKRDPRYFTDVQDQIYIPQADTYILVCTQWTNSSFKEFIQLIKLLDANISII